MSDRRSVAAQAPSVVEIDSGDEYESPVFTAAPSRSRHASIIEITSDASDDEDIEIVSETGPRPAANNGQADIQITGHVHRPSVVHIEYPGGPPSRPGSGPGSRPVSRPHSRSHSRQAGRPGPRPAPRNHPRQEAFARNVRRRTTPNPLHDIYRAAFFQGGHGFPVLSHHDIPAMLAEHQHQLLHFFGQRDEEVSSSIMERISREEENTLDRKMESENKHNRSVLQKKMGVAQAELDGYTNNIAPEENIMCELCGVVLGEGIPADFVPDAKYDKNLEHYAASSRVMAPWFCVRQCFDTDRELSKRVFAAKCGHVYCGRCIKNIGSRPQGRGGKSQKEISILNPQISAPRKCPARECGATFNKGKKTFTELFL